MPKITKIFFDSTESEIFQTGLAVIFKISKTSRAAKKTVITLIIDQVHQNEPRAIKAKVSIQRIDVEQESTTIRKHICKRNSSKIWSLR